MCLFQNNNEYETNGGSASLHIRTVSFDQAGFFFPFFSFLFWLSAGKLKMVIK